MRIELSAVSFSYGQEPILRDANITLNSGTLTLLCGQSGSGKSTLLQIAAGLEKPERGSVSYQADGISLDGNEARRKIGIVFQMPEDQLFAGTVREDVEYGLKLQKVPRGDRFSLAEKALRMVGLEPSEFLDRSPFLLSGGEKRRVAIAGALALQPDFLILDEPTAGLDPEAAGTVRYVLQQLRDAGITILVSTHDLDLFFPMAEQVIVLRQGQISYTGDARELLTKSEILEDAGLELPAAASIARRLRQLGLPVNTALTVEELLPALHTVVLARDMPRKPEASRSFEEQAACGAAQDAAAAFSRFEPQATFNKQDTSLLEQLDPRAKWVGMVLLCISILSVSTIWGLMAAAGASFAILRLGRISLRRVLKLVKPLLPMFLFVLVVGAVSFGEADAALGPVGINYAGAARSGLGVSRFLLVLIVGIVFSDSTSGAPLREGLEWAIRPLRKIGVPTRDISLAVTIAVQFLPWVLERFWQLRKAVQSRGQDTIGIRRFSPAQLTVLMVPLLISLLKMGDELATAIESRGYNRQAERTSWYELCWSRKDTVSCLTTIFLAGLLLWG